MSLSVFGTLHGSLQAMGGGPPGSPMLPGLLSKRGDCLGWVWAPRPINAGQRDASAHWALPSEPVLGLVLDAEGAADLSAAAQIEIGSGEASWGQQGLPSRATSREDHLG